MLSLTWPYSASNTWLGRRAVAAAPTTIPTTPTTRQRAMTKVTTVVPAVWMGVTTLAGNSRPPPAPRTKRPVDVGPERVPAISCTPPRPKWMEGAGQGGTRLQSDHRYGKACRLGPLYVIGATSIFTMHMPGALCRNRQLFRGYSPCSVRNAKYQLSTPTNDRLCNGADVR